MVFLHDIRACLCLKFLRALSVKIEGIEGHIPLIDDLIRNKRTSERTKDLADARVPNNRISSPDWQIHCAPTPAPAGYKKRYCFKL